MFKKVFLCLLLTSGTVFASELKEEEFQGNWTGSFRLKDGSVIEHFPNKVVLGGWMSGGTGITLQSKSYNGISMSEEGLNVKTRMSQEAFIKALKASGLYDQ